MSYVLGIDTTEPHSSLALLGVESGKLFETVSEESYSSESLMRMLVHLLRDNAIELPEITEIVVANGPGSFTGIRAGIATALGLARARAVPLRALSNFAARSVVAHQLDGLVMPTLWANRGERFYTLCRVSSSSVEHLTEISAFRFEDEAATIAKLEKDFGLAAGSLRSVALDCSPESRPTGAACLCSARALQERGLRDENGAIGDIAPLYVKRVNAATIADRKGA